MVLRIERHSVVSLALPDRKAPYDFVRCRVNDRKNVLILKVHVDLTRHRIVLRHSCFTVEMQGLHDLVFSHIDDGFGFATLVRDVQLVERGCVSASVWLRFRFQLLDNLHLLQVDDANCVVMRVRRIELLEFRNIFHAFGAGRVANRRHDFVRSELNDICPIRRKMCRNQVVVVGVDRQVVEALSSRSREVNRCNAPKRLSFGKNTNQNVDS